MIEREHIKIIRNRIDEPRKFIQVIVGPRQVGKTTMIEQLLDKIKIAHRYETGDNAPLDGSIWLSQIWETARLQMKSGKLNEFLLVIDEVQKISQWSEIVKKEWDQDSREKLNLKVILLGSSRLLIQKGLTESLAGRFETININHWSFTEMKKAFGWNLKQYIYFGGYPGSADLIKDIERWKEYILNSLIETSISKDILMLTRIDKPALLKHLFELGARYSSQILSYNKMLGQLKDAGNTTTLANYLHLLEECGLLGGIEKYSGSILATRSSSPKFQVFNNALTSVYFGKNFNQAVEDTVHWGRLAESAVGTHLINARIKEKYNLYYWRQDNCEVDFVIEKNGKIAAIEVKSGFKPANNGMSVFSKKYGSSKLLLVGASGIPLEEFLTISPSDLF